MRIDVEIPASNLTVTASSTFSPEQAVRHLIDGSGLSGGWHDQEGGARTMWHTVEKPAATAAAGIESPAWVQFTFDPPQAIDHVLIWNHNQAGYTDRGFRRTRVLGTADGRSWRKLVECELPRAGGNSATATVVSLPAQALVRSVVIAAESNYGGDCYGLGEVQFAATRDVAESDLPFPSGLASTARPFYAHRRDGSPGRVIHVALRGARLYGQAAVAIEAGGVTETTRFENLRGAAELDVLLPSGVGVTNECPVALTLRQGQRSVTQTIAVPARRQWTMMLFPHSHVDVGYTNPQDVVEKIHMRNLEVGLELGKATERYPEGARHVWNNEVLWAVDSWLQRADAAQKQAFVSAVRAGQIGLSASYANLNTSTASDEELFHDFAFARRLRELTGTPIDTMCQFDIPGLSWGLIQAAACNGVRAILDFPNPSDRVGNVHVWRNRPVRWIAPDGKTSVLYLQVFPYNVAWKLGAFNMRPRPYEDVPGRDRVHFASSPFNGSGEFRFEDFVFRETAQLEAAGSPYDIYPCAWSLSDNAPVDVDLPDYVQRWNEQYAFPRLVIASASTIATAFETRFGKIIPEVRGDLTEYWTDGLGSDARRVGYNRVAKESLIQSEMLWPMLRRGERPPVADYYAAWRWIQLGTEHTWGYMNPDQPIAKTIEAVKASYFEKAKAGSEELLERAASAIAKPGAGTVAVINTLSWDRGGLVVLSPAQRGSAQSVVGAASQWLSSGELVFQADAVPALGSRLYPLSPERVAYKIKPMAVDAATLENEFVRVALNPETGDIASLVDKRTGHDYVNAASPYALNSFRYLRGGDAPAKARGPTGVKLSIKENGPVLASLLVEAEAEGCRRLTREIRILAGRPQVEIFNTVDKISTRAKEGVHFGFAFNLPTGSVARMDIPWGVMDPVTDQLEGANKNWLACQRWIDVSGDDRGVTWVPQEAAIVEYGDITANLLGPVALGSWRKEIGDVRTLISWALNNHWHTNFPLEQGGLIPFRYAILPHGAYDPVTANRFGLEQSRPLLAVATDRKDLGHPLVALDNPRLFLSTLKTTDDGKAILLRIRSLSAQPETARLRFPGGAPATLSWSDANEAPGQPVAGEIALLPYGVATLRLEFTR